MVDKKLVAEAISRVNDPFSCSDIIEEIGLEHSEKNRKEVKSILKYFEKRNWVTNSVNSLYFRSFERFVVR